MCVWWDLFLNFSFILSHHPAASRLSGRKCLPRQVLWAICLAILCFGTHRSSASTLLPSCFTDDYRKLAANLRLWEKWQGVCGATATWHFANKNGWVKGWEVRSDDVGLKEDISITWPDARVEVLVPKLSGWRNHTEDSKFPGSGIYSHFL